MGKLIIAGVIVLAAVLVGGPFGIVLIVGGLLVPSVAGQAVPCIGSLPATGEWRVPFVDTTYAITSGFEMRVDPVTGSGASLHNGVDLATTQSPIVAAAGGTVTFAGHNGNGFGNHVIIDHGAGITTLYGHLADIEPGITAGTSLAIGQRMVKSRVVV